MKFKTKSMIATCIILIISGSAFAAGFIQSYFLEKITNLKEEITDLEARHDKMESKAASLRDSDINFFFIGMDYYDEAKWLDYEFDILNTTLTTDERKVYVYRISSLLQKSINYRDLTTIIIMYRHFNESTNDLIIASEEIEGYNYTISWELWQSFILKHGAPVIETNATEAYGDFFSFGYIQSRPLNERPRDLHDHEIFLQLQFKIGVLSDFFLFNPIIELQGEINEKLNSVDILESQSSGIALGVSFTTVGVILSAAMANRLTQKKMEREFEKVREKEERLAKKKHDLISIPVLIIAVVLSMFGVILPLILNL